MYKLYIFKLEYTNIKCRFNKTGSSSRKQEKTLLSEGIET